MAGDTLSKQPPKSPLTFSSSNNEPPAKRHYLTQHEERTTTDDASTPTEASPASVAVSSVAMEQPFPHDSTVLSSTKPIVRGPLETEATASPNGRITPEWKKRWFKNTRTHRDNQQKLFQQQQQEKNDENIADFTSFSYQGGQMKADTPVVAAASTSHTISNPAPNNHPFLPTAATSASSSSYNDATPLQRIQSWMTRSSTDSLHDFDESEWTPADSSYGAAIPVAGWIPKHRRRMIEYSLIAAAVAILVYILVASSIQITADARNNNNSGNNDSSGNSENGNVNLDDQFYVSVYNDDLDQSNTNGDDNYNGRKLRSLRSVIDRNGLFRLWSDDGHEPDLSFGVADSAEETLSSLKRLES